MKEKKYQVLDTEFVTFFGSFLVRDFYLLVHECVYNQMIMEMTLVSHFRFQGI